MSDVVAVGQLRAFVERVERLEEEIKTLNDDKSEVYKEMRGFGFDVKAVRKVVAKRKLDPSVANEQDAVFDLYWDALTGASHVHVHEEGNSYAAEKGIDREARRKQRMSESMDDSIALSAEAVALGLIDPAAHEETVRIADAVARKFGNGPLNEQIDPDTGEITNSPETANEVPAQDGKGTGFGESLSGKSNAARPASVDAQLNVEGMAGEVIDRGVTAGETAQNFEPPAFLQSKPLKTARDYRPHCQKPDACGASGLQHCYSCSKLIPEKGEAA
ncbi:DUF2312 domain-containing protein [Phyllobacterium sp. K27]